MNTPNWVQARGTCNLEDTFKGIMDAVQKDVRIFNKLTPKQRDGRLYHVEKKQTSAVVFRAHEVQHEGKTILVVHPDYKDDGLHVSLTDDIVVVTRPGAGNGVDRLEIQPRWNEETLVCDLYIGSNVYPLWRVSQEIIGDFMFDDSQ